MILKSDFIVAVHSLVYLRHKGCISSSEELAKNVCTNPVRVRKIMSKLKKLGAISTREGHVGGYCPCENIEKLDLATIAEGLGTVFVETKWHSGSDDLPCLISNGMAPIFDNLYSELNAQCMKELGKITIGTLEKKIFK